MGHYSVDFGVKHAGLQTVGVTQLAADGSTVVERSTAGIVDMGLGCYGVSLTPDPSARVIRWDTGSESTVYAHDSVSDWDAVIEAGYTAEQVLRVMAAALAGTTQKTGNTVTFKGLDGTSDRIIGSFDAENNRTGAVLDGS